MIGELDDATCWELVAASTVGRLGWVADSRVLVLPVNYVVDAGTIVIRTAPDGELSRIEDAAAELAFEVDHHDRVTGSGWSVLMGGTLTPMSEDEAAAVSGLDRVVPWAGGDRSLHLRFTPRTLSGRTVQRTRTPQS